MLAFTLKHPHATHDMLGLLPDIFDSRDPRPAKAQANDRYSHGGGWTPFEGFRVTSQGLVYPGDPPMHLIAEAHLRTETIRLYENAWVGIFQEDGSYEISRMD